IYGVLFERDGKRVIFGDALEDLHIADVQLVATRGTLVGANSADDDDGRLLREMLDALKDFGRHCGFRHDPLDETAAVAKDWKEQLAALPQVVKPSANRDALPVAGSDLGDRGNRGLGSGNRLFFDFHKCFYRQPSTPERLFEA